MKRLILFDIDGTLLWTRGAAKRAFHGAMLEVYGTAGPIATHSFAGKTDPQIARELLRLAGLADAAIDAGLTALWAAYLRGLRSALALPGHRTEVMPGVPALLAALERSSGEVLLGLLTGNIEEGAALKLASAGIDGAFRVGAYGSDRERREDLPELAVDRAEKLTGERFRGRDIVVVGDTPNDIQCGQPLGVHTFAVATGGYDADSLRAAGAETVFEDLSDTSAVLDALLCY